MSKTATLIQTQLQRTTLSHIQSTIVNKKYGKTFLTLCTAGADCTGAKVQGKQVRLKLQPCLPNGQGSWFLLYGSVSSIATLYEINAMVIRNEWQLKLKN